jgi:hypothetical protein
VDNFVTGLAVVEADAIPHDERCPVCHAGLEEAAPEEWDHTGPKKHCGHLYGHDCLVEPLTATTDMLFMCPLCRQDVIAFGN